SCLLCRRLPRRPQGRGFLRGGSSWCPVSARRRWCCVVWALSVGTQDGMPCRPLSFIEADQGGRAPSRRADAATSPSRRADAATSPCRGRDGRIKEDAPPPAAQTRRPPPVGGGMGGSRRTRPLPPRRRGDLPLPGEGWADQGGRAPSRRADAATSPCRG